MKRPLTTTPVRTLPLLLLAAVLAAALLLTPEAAAQPEPEVDDSVPALISVTGGVGLPSYRTAHAGVSLQLGAVGAAAQVGYGPGVGASFLAQGRYYPPLPGMPVPVWAGGGGSFAAGSFTPHVALGTHIPVAPRWRVELEAGVAWPRIGLDRHLAPHLGVGVGYAFAVDLTPRDHELDVERERLEGSRCEPGPPDPELLPAALAAAERRFVNDLRAAYGSLYRDLRYQITVLDTQVRGDRAELMLAYRGSVREIATGTRHQAEGEAEAGFRWTGCAWRHRALRY